MTRPAADGVLGLITLIGKGCSLQVDPALLRLLDAGGRALIVARARTDEVNPATAMRPDFPEGAGSVRVGFAWTGSWCGPRPASVELAALPSAASPKPVRVAWNGAEVPRCVAGQSGRLVPGIVGAPTSPVEPAPAQWAALHARVVVAKTVKEGPVPVKIQLTNTGAVAVSLAAPCPTYNLSFSYPTVAGRGFGGPGQDIFGTFGDFCDKPLVLGAGKSVTVPLAAVPYQPQGPWKVGGEFTATWSMAGVAPATGVATIR